MNYSITLAHPWTALLLFLALAAWSLAAYRRTMPVQSPTRRWLLRTLRLSASLVLALMLGGITLHGEGVEELKPGLRVLQDVSASMQRRDVDPDRERSRHELASAFAERLRERWADKLDIDLRPFGLDLLDGDAPPLAEEPGTDIAAALEGLPGGAAREQVLLLSDGRDSEGGLWGGRISQGPAIHAVLLGDSLPPPDLRIEGVDALPVIHKGARLPLTVDISAQGGAARSGRLLLREDGDLILEHDWVLPEGRNTLRIDAPFTLDESGRHLVEILLEADGPDEAPENDSRLLSLRVVEGKLRILVLAGSPDWDLAAISHGLRGETFLELVVVTAGEKGMLRRAADGSEWRPEDEEYHGLLLHSVHRSWPADLLRRVRLRGGVLLLGSYLENRGRSFTPEAWNVDRFLPGRLIREARLAWGRDAARHPAVQGVTAAGLRPEDLAALESVFAGPLRGGRVLLRADDQPVLTALERGGRRVAAFSGRGFWRWRLREGEGGLLCAELFSGLLRWLAREDPPDRLLLDWGGTGLAAGRSGELRAEFFDPDFEPRAGAQIDWSLRLGDELKAVGSCSPGERLGHYACELPALPAGIYTLRAEARDPAGETLTREMPMPVLSPKRELLYPASDAATMRWLAERSGGTFQTLSAGTDVSELLDGLASKLDFKPVRLKRSSELRLWQHPLLFLLLLALLGLEWGLRKHFGMI